MDVSDEELARRRAEWVAPPLKVTQGALYKYTKTVSDASHGCGECFFFLLVLKRRRLELTIRTPFFVLFSYRCVRRINMTLNAFLQWTRASFGISAALVAEARKKTRRSLKAWLPWFRRRALREF